MELLPFALLVQQRNAYDRLFAFEAFEVLLLVLLLLLLNIIVIILLVLLHETSQLTDLRVLAFLEIKLHQE